MKKAFFVLLIIFALIGAFFGFSKKNSVVKTIPSPQGLHDPYLPIIIYFNHEPNINQFHFSITPETVFSINTGPNKSIILTPEKGLTPSTDYKLSINTNPLFELVFKTDQLGSNYPGWNDAFEAAALTSEKNDTAQSEALYAIRKQTPIKEDGFVVDYSYKTNVYNVTLSSPYGQNKTKFLDWIKQKGVSDVTKIKIKYINL